MSYIVESPYIFSDLESFKYSIYNYISSENEIQMHEGETRHCRFRVKPHNCSSVIQLRNKEYTISKHSPTCSLKINREYNSLLKHFKNDKAKIYSFLTEMMKFKKVVYNEEINLLHRNIRNKVYTNVKTVKNKIKDGINESMSDSILKTLTTKEERDEIALKKDNIINTKDRIKLSKIKVNIKENNVSDLVKNGEYDKLNDDYTIVYLEKEIETIFDKMKPITLDDLNIDDAFIHYDLINFEKAIKANYMRVSYRNNEFIPNTKVLNSMNDKISNTEHLKKCVIKVLSYVKNEIKDIFQKNSESDFMSANYVCVGKDTEKKQLRSITQKNNELNLFENNDNDLVKGYGSVGASITIDLLIFLGNITKSSKVEKMLDNNGIKDSYKYNLTKNSVFIDLGSGYGLPNFACFLLYGCKNYGYEFMTERLRYSVVTKYQKIAPIIKKMKIAKDVLLPFNAKKYDELKFEVNELLSTITFKIDLESNQNLSFISQRTYNLDYLRFERNNIFDDNEFKNDINDRITHIYCYGKLFEDKDNKHTKLKMLAKKINKLKWKVLVWNVCEQKMETIGVQNAIYVTDFVGYSSGHSQSFKFYIYINLKTNEEKKIKDIKVVKLDEHSFDN